MRHKFAVGTIVKDKDGGYYKIIDQRRDWYECSHWCCMWRWPNDEEPKRGSTPYKWGWSDTIFGLKCTKVHKMTKISRLEVLVVLGKEAVDGS